MNVVCEDEDILLRLLLLVVIVVDEEIGDELFVNLRSRRCERRCNGVGSLVGSGD